MVWLFVVLRVGCSCCRLRGWVCGVILVCMKC